MNAQDILVVGGTSGVGLEIVRALCQSGHAPTVACRNRAALAEFAGIRHLPLDDRLLTFPAEGLPETLQGLVYCPGTIRLRPIQMLTEEDFLSDYRINLLGAVVSIQACLTRLKKSPSGAAIVLFSTVAVQTGMPFHASIASAKGAVEGLTRSLAAELAPRIRVNAVAPSLTDTRLAAELLSNTEKRRQAAERHPLKRIGSAVEVARAAVYLLSEEAAWISGQVFHVDGGMSSLRTFR